MNESITLIQVVYGTQRDNRKRQTYLAMLLYIWGEMLSTGSIPQWTVNSATGKSSLSTATRLLKT